MIGSTESTSAEPTTRSSCTWPKVTDHVLNNLDDFKEAPAAALAMPFSPMSRERDPYLEYEVNIVVENAQTSGAPIIVESVPTDLNLFSTIERIVDRFGRVVTNFTPIKSLNRRAKKGDDGIFIARVLIAREHYPLWRVRHVDGLYPGGGHDELQQ